MASLTVRQLDEKLKRQVRTILRSAAADGDSFAPAQPADTPRQTARNAKTGAKHILLIIGGGIAAYKSLDLIRRLRERGAAVRVVMTDAAQKFITPLSV